MFCPNCGNEISPEAAFCGNCGATLSSPSDATQQVTPKKRSCILLLGGVTVSILLIFYIAHAVLSFSKVEHAPANHTIAASLNHDAAIINEGHVVSSGIDHNGSLNTSSWQDIISISLGYETSLGLKKDGTVIAVGNNEANQCEVSDWRDVIDVAAGRYFSAGLKKDGKVLYTFKGYDQRDLEEASSWNGIIDIDASYKELVAADSSGKVRVLFDNEKFADIKDWSGVSEVSAGSIDAANCFILGLREDGTVLASSEAQGKEQIESWKDIVSVDSGWQYSAALTNDGHVLLAGNIGDIQEATAWTGIIEIAAGDHYLLGKKEDGSLVWTGQTGLGVEEIVSLAQ